MESEDFFFFDELNYYRKLYEKSRFEPKDELYKIHSPFMMDSEFIAKTSEVRKRNRKRKMRNNSENWLSQRSESIEQTWKSFKIKHNNLHRSLPPDNNVEARETTKNAPDFTCLPADNTSSLGIQLLCSGLQSKSPEATLFKNEKDGFSTVKIGSSNFLIPSRASFILSDVSVVRQFVNYGLKFDLIVMDPPWSNKSVKRKKAYDCFDLNDLKLLPIPEILDENGLVVIWLTNNEKVHENLPKILDHWGLREITRWHWLKVTTNGEPVYPFNSPHKVPFESLAFACQPTHFEGWCQRFIKDYCIISVPNASHSRKPPIASILEMLNVFSGNSCLELYARYLLANTMSVGFECVKFQDVYYFNEK